MNWTSVKVVPGRIGGDSPSVGSVARSGRKLKPAVYDPDSVDIDNDGWHQEGTTAQWYGIGRNNQIFKTLKTAFRNTGGKKPDEAALKLFADYEKRYNAPPLELSDEDTDISFISGVMHRPGSDADGWEVPAFMTAKSFLQYRKEKREALKGTGTDPKAGNIDAVVTPNSEGSVKDAIKRLVEARKRRREEREARFQQEVQRMISDEEKRKAEIYRVNFVDLEGNPDTPNARTQQYDEAVVEATRKWDQANPSPSVTEITQDPGNAEKLRQWERANPEPTPDLYDDRHEFAQALGEWSDERQDQIREMIKLSSTEWSQRRREFLTAERDRLRKELLEDSDLPAEPVDGNELIRELFTFDVVGRDGKSYTFQVEDVDDPYDMGATMTGAIYSEDGTLVGNFTRTFNPEGREVHNDLLILTQDAQSLGLASIINARNEEIYKLMGIEKVTLAGLSNGKQFKGATHWPKNGFDWLDEWEREKFLGKMEGFLRGYEIQKRQGKDVIPVFTRQIFDSNGNITGTITTPMFASEEEYEIVKKMVSMAASQSFDDPNRLTADDLLQWNGAEEGFKVGATTINYKREI